MRLAPYLRLGFALVFALVLSSAFGGIRESPEWIVNSRTHSFMRNLSEQLGFDNVRLPKGHSVAWISTAGCNIRVTIVGPIEGDAKRYANIINDWRARNRLPGDVLWTQEDDSSAAEYRYQPGHFGLSSATTLVDIDELRDILAGAEAQTEIALADAQKSGLRFRALPDYTFPSGTRYWNLTSSKPRWGKAMGTITIPGWMPWLLLAWFLIPPFGVVGSFIAAITVSKNEGIPLAQRRRLYGRVVTVGSSVALGFHGVLVLATLPTRLFEPLTQLWFGERFTQLALPIVPLFVVVPFLCLPLALKYEKRLMAPSPQEATQQISIPPRLIAPRKLGLFGWVMVSLLVLGMVGKFGLTFTDKNFPNRHSTEFVTTLLCFMPLVAFILSRGTPKFEVEPDAMNQATLSLRQSVEAMAAKLSMVAPPSRVLTESIYGRFGAIADSRGIGLTIQALELLQPGEIDFLVAHELAHRKLGHIRARLFLSVGPLLFVLIPFTFLTMGRSLSVATPAFIYSPFLLPIALMIPYSFYLRRVFQKQEFEADRTAFQATGDRETAIETLRKITLNSASPGIHDTDMAAHPAVQARIAAIGRLS